MDKPLVLIGGGGHCKSCIDVIESAGFRIRGIIDKEPCEPVFGYTYLGNDEQLKQFVLECSFLVTVGQINSAAIRIKLFQQLTDYNANLMTIISPYAVVSRHSSVGKGTIVMHQSIINAGAQVGKNCIVNTKALVEHDCRIGNHVHISTTAVVNGNCKIGNGVFIGSNAVIGHGVRIVDDVVVGAGSVVIENITQSGTYVGSPARRI